MMSYEDYYNSDFQKALREVQAQDQTKQEVDIKNKCYHPYTTNSDGWKICVTCGLCLRRIPIFFGNKVFCDRVLLRKKEPNRV